MIVRAETNGDLVILTMGVRDAEDIRTALVFGIWDPSNGWAKADNSAVWAAWRALHDVTTHEKTFSDRSND